MARLIKYINPELLNKFGREIKNYVDKEDLSISTKIQFKQDKLNSGFNIKTINGESILGAGDMKVITDLTGYAKEEYVDEKTTELKENIDEVEAKIPSIEGLASEDFVTAKIIAEKLAREEADLELREYVDEHTPDNYVKLADYSNDVISITKVVDGQEITFTTDPLASKEFATDKATAAETNAKAYTDVKIGELGSVFTIKGSKPTVADLPTEGNNQGDVWYILENGASYVWVDVEGTRQWRQLGMSIDLSGYATKEEVATVEAKIPDITPLATKVELADVAAAIPSIEGLATEEFVTDEIAKVEEKIPDVTNFTTKTYVDTTIDTLHEVYQPIGSYATKDDLTDCLSKTAVKETGLETFDIKINGLRIYTTGSDITFDASELFNGGHKPLATKEDVQAAINGLIDSAPETLDTLAKIAEALKSGEGTMAAIMTAIDTKAAKSSLARVATTGDYNDLFNKPTIVDRTTPVSYFVDDGTYTKLADVMRLLEQFATKAYVDSKLTSVFKYKGKVQTFDELPTDAQSGDFWWVVEPKEEGQDGNMSYLWDGNAWKEFMPMGQGGGGATSIIHVEELPIFDQELDKLYQITKPKFYTNIYALVQGFLFKNELRGDGYRVTAKIVDIESLDILDASPLYKEWYDESLEEGGIEITVYRCEGQIYYWAGEYIYDEETGEEKMVAVGEPQLFDEEHPAFPFAHAFQGQAEVDRYVEMGEDLELNIVNAEPWPLHQMFTLTVTDADGNEQVGHFTVVQNDDPEPNGDDPDEDAVRHWGLECDNDYFYNEGGSWYEKWAIRITDYTYCTDPMANKWYVQYKLKIWWLLDKGATNIRLEPDEENYSWIVGEASPEDVFNFGGYVEGQKDCIIGTPYHEGTIVKEASSEYVWCGYDINWGEKVFDWRPYDSESEDDWKPIYYYGFGECRVQNEDGDVLTFTLRTYSQYKTEANTAYPLSGYLAISRDRRNNDVFECEGKTYKVIDALDPEGSGQVFAALITNDEDEEDFPYGNFVITCDDAYIFQIDSAYLRKVKIPITHDGQIIGNSRLWDYNAQIKLRKESDSCYCAEWYDKDNPSYMITNCSTYDIQDGYAIFETYYFYGYQVTYLFDDIIAGVKIIPVVDNRVVVFRDLRAPTYSYEQPMEMGGSYGKAQALSFYTALDWDGDDIRVAVSDKLFFVDMYSMKLWFENISTDINEMYMYDESKFRKLITEKDFEEASSNFITPDNIKDYVKISNFVYWDSDRPLPDLSDADANKIYIKNDIYYHPNKDRWNWHAFDTMITVPEGYSSLYDYFSRTGQWQQEGKLYAFTTYKYNDAKLEGYYYYHSSSKWQYATNAAASPTGYNFKPVQLYFAKWDAYSGYPIEEERFICHSGDETYKLCVVDTLQGQWIGYYDDLNTRFKLYYLDYNSRYGWREITIGSQIFSGPIFRGFANQWDNIPENPADGDLYIKLTDTNEVFTRTTKLYYYSNNGGKYYCLDQNEIDYNTMEPKTAASSDKLIQEVTYLPAPSSAQQGIIYNWKSNPSYITDSAEYTLLSAMYGRKNNELRTDTLSAGTARCYSPTVSWFKTAEPWMIAYPFGKSISDYRADHYRAGFEQNYYTYLRICYNLQRKSFTFNQKAYMDNAYTTYKVNQWDGTSSDTQYQSVDAGTYLPLVLLESWVRMNIDKIPSTSEWQPMADDAVFYLGKVTGTDNNGVETTYDLGVFDYIYQSQQFRMRLKSPNRTIFVTANYNNQYYYGYRFNLGGVVGPKNPIVSVKIDNWDALGAIAFFDQKDWNNDSTYKLPYFYGVNTYQTCPFSNVDGSSKTLNINNGVKSGDKLFSVGGKNFYFMYIPTEYQKESPNPSAYCRVLADTDDVDALFKADGTHDLSHIYARNYVYIYSDYPAAKGLTRLVNNSIPGTWEDEQEKPMVNYESFYLDGSSYSSYARVPEGQMQIYVPYIIAGFMDQVQAYEDTSLVNLFTSTDINPSGNLNVYIQDFKPYKVDALCMWNGYKWTYIDITGNMDKKLTVTSNLSLSNGKLDVNTASVANAIMPTVDAKLDQRVKKYYNHDVEINMNNYVPTKARFNLISSRSGNFLTDGMSNQERYKMMISYLKKPVLITKNDVVHMGYLSECYKDSTIGIDNFIFKIEFTDGTDPIQMQGAGFYVVNDIVEEIL